MRTIDMVQMRRCGASIAEISKKAGIPAKDVSDRLEAYEHDGRDYICSVFSRRHPGAYHARKHPEQKGR